jgi:hypothetical protein
MNKTDKVLGLTFFAWVAKNKNIISQGVNSFTKKNQGI